MILNETKTKAMLATGKWIEKRMNNQQLQVKLNTTELKQVSSQKLLGVTIDQKLSIDDHINELCNKICQRIAMLSKIKWFLPLKQRKAFYKVMTKQTMLYASNVWSVCSTGNLQRVFCLQKRSARINTPANSDELFTRLGLASPAPWGEGEHLCSGSQTY